MAQPGLLSAPTREWVVLVDGEDRPVGTAEKMDAHRNPRLHRAFSVFVLDGRNRLLLQKRARGKYHSGGLWTNTCCGHPRPGEDTDAAAQRRLREEMGLDCPVTFAFSFEYREELEDGLVEHELDHVFVGRYEGDPEPDPREAEGWRWTALEEVSADARRRPECYTVWFPMALARLRTFLSSQV